MSDASAAKAELRREMRAMRRALSDRAVRSERIWAVVRELPEVAAADTIMVFHSVPGEPETGSFVEWCRDLAKTVVFPEDDPPLDPETIDVVIVPGTAFTAAGDRLGQGGGWYDRFLSGVRTECVTIGVAFEPQIVDVLPVNEHDVTMDMVVTDVGGRSKQERRRAHRDGPSDDRQE